MGIDKMETENSAGNFGIRNNIGKLYLVFLGILAIALLTAFVVDKYYEYSSFGITGFVVFCMFYFVSTAFVVWFVRTNKTNSLWADAWKRLLRNKLATFGLVVIWVIGLVVSIGPSIIFWTTGFTPDFIPPEAELINAFAPTFAHPMGTDDAGRDMLARVLQGGRISLMVGIISTIVSLIIGVSYGATAAYLGGKVDGVMMRIVDIIYSIPYILIVIVLLQVFGGENVKVLVKAVPTFVSICITFGILAVLILSMTNAFKEIVDKIGLNVTQFKVIFIALAAVFLWTAIDMNVWLHATFLTGIGSWLTELYSTYVNKGLSQIFLLFFALGLVSWLTMARVVRGQVLSLKNQEFVLAAQATGVSTVGIIFKHLVPNTLGPVIVYATLTIPSVMLTEAFLSFLGLGVQAPYASWGSLASDGIKNIALFPWQLIFPGATMALTLFSLNFLGDGLRDALDPQTRKF